MSVLIVTAKYTKEFLDSLFLEDMCPDHCENPLMRKIQTAHILSAQIDAAIMLEDDGQALIETLFECCHFLEDLSFFKAVFCHQVNIGVLGRDMFPLQLNAAVTTAEVMLGALRFDLGVAMLGNIRTSVDAEGFLKRFEDERMPSDHEFRTPFDLDEAERNGVNRGQFNKLSKTFYKRTQNLVITKENDWREMAREMDIAGTQKTNH